MTRLRFRRSALTTLVLTLAVIQTGSAQTFSKKPVSSATTQDTLAIVDARVPASSLSSDRSYKIYSLNDFGNDPGVCEWIAQTIPDVIAAGTWGGQGVLRYHASKNILVVCHTSAVQAQVDSFLKDVKKSLAESANAKAAAPKSLHTPRKLVQAEYSVPLPDVTNPTPASSPSPTISYPVPAQSKTPKHLFHYIIRYEGEGIIDDNVVKAMKGYLQASNEPRSAAAPAAASTAVAPAGAVPTASPPAPVAPAPAAPAVAPGVATSEYGVPAPSAYAAPATPPGVIGYGTPVPTSAAAASVAPTSAPRYVESPVSPSKTSVKAKKKVKKKDKGTQKEKQTR